MAKAGIKINLKGFDKILEQLQEANVDIDVAASQAIKESAQIFQDELIAEAKAKNVPPDITSQVRKETSHAGDRYSAEVGWKLENYDPKKPSAGYKAIFLNFGTVRRQTSTGKNRGMIPKRSQDQQFIHMAKKNARSKIKKIQKEILKNALGDLKK